MAPTAEAIARAFHERYEALAGEHGWETQQRSRVPWEDVPDENRSLMIAVVERLLDDGVIAPPA
jgi:hypothetical protein